MRIVDVLSRLYSFPLLQGLHLVLIRALAFKKLQVSKYTFGLGN